MRPNASMMAIRQLLKLLCSREYSRAQLAELTGLRYVTICQYLKILHRRPGNLVYISKYTRPMTVGPYTEYYSFGYCVDDIPRPTALTKAVRNRRARDKAIKPLIVKTDKGIKHVSQ
jgi:hypothetical protein